MCHCHLLISLYIIYYIHKYALLYRYAPILFISINPIPKSLFHSPPCDFAIPVNSVLARKNRIGYLCPSRYMAGIPFTILSDIIHYRGTPISRALALYLPPRPSADRHYKCQLLYCIKGIIMNALFIYTVQCTVLYIACS